MEFQSKRCQITALEKLVLLVCLLTAVPGGSLGAPNWSPLKVPMRTMIKLLHSGYLARKVLDLLGMNNLRSVDNTGVVGFLHFCQLFVFDLLGRAHI